METYNLNDLAMMTGFTTRTLRNYLNQGLLEGEKEPGPALFWISPRTAERGTPFPPSSAAGCWRHPT